MIERIRTKVLWAVIVLAVVFLVLAHRGEPVVVPRLRSCSCH